MEVTIRPAKQEDLAGILTLERQAPSAPHWLDSDYRKIITPGTEPQRCLLVAECANAPVGFAVGRFVAGIGELESVVVAEAFQHKGIGYQLCYATLLWCGRAGATEVNLEVRESSRTAVRLYGRLRFVEMGRRPGYYGNPPEDAMLMRCTAPGPDEGEP